MSTHVLSLPHNADVLSARVILPGVDDREISQVSIRNRIFGVPTTLCDKLVQQISRLVRVRHRAPDDGATGRLNRAARRKHLRQRRRTAIPAAPSALPVWRRVARQLAAPAGAAAILLATGIAGSTGASAQGFANLCTGLSINLPVLAPVTGIASSALNTLAPGLGTVLGGNFGLLSGRNIGLSVLDPGGNPLAPGNCGLSADGFQIDNNKGISFGGGQITGLGGTGNTVATANEVTAIAIGNGSVTAVGAQNAIAIGSNANATLSGSIAMGNGASSTYANSIAIGTGTNASGSAVAQGVTDFRTAGNPNQQIVNAAPGTLTMTPSAVALGENSVVNAGGGVALGYNNNAGSTNGFFSTAIGASNLASGAYATALGVNNTASGTNSISVGVNNTSSGLRSIALGRQAQATGDYAIAQGFRATAATNGTPADAVRNGAIAIGTDAVAGLDNGGTTLAIGNRAAATTPANTGDSLALGTDTTANAVDSIAIGAQTSATATNTIAIGNNGTVNAGANAIVIGIGSNASTAASGSVVFGNNSAASAANTTVLGRNASATGAGSVALGFGSQATRTGLNGPEAFSRTVVASGNGAVSIGVAGGERQITAVAGGTQATDAVNVRQLSSVGTNLAGSFGGGAAFDPTTGAYTAPSFTVGGQSYGTVALALTAITGGSTTAGVKYFHANSTGPDSSATGIDAVAVGANTVASGQNSIAIGGNAIAANAANAVGLNSVAIGSSAKTTGGFATAVGIGSSAQGEASAFGEASNAGGQTALAAGFRANASGQNSTAIGGTANSAGQYSLAAGTSASAQGLSSTALGNDARAVGAQSVAIGGSGGTGNANAAQALAASGVAIGAKSTATNAGDVALGANATTTATVATAGTTIGGTAQTFAGAVPTAALSVGGRQIQNVAAGQLSAVSTDGVNGSQLFATNTQLGTTMGALTASLGAGAAFDPVTGAYIAPTFTTALGTTATTVQDALTNETTAITALGNGTATKLGGGVTYDTTTGGLAGGFTVNGTTYADVATAISGTASTGGVVQRTLVPNQVAITAPGGSGAVPGPAQMLTNVAQGTLTATSTDAVNGSQLFATNTQVTNNTNAITTINNGGGIKYFHTNSTGIDSVAAGTDSIAVGPAAVSSAAGAIALGQGATASYAGGVAIGSGSATGLAAPTGVGYAIGTAAPASAVSVGSAAAQRRIANVSAGSAATDAANVGQLNQVAQNTASALGGGTAYDPTTGAYTASSYTVGGKAYTDVGSALAAGNALGVQYTPNALGAPTNAVDLTKGGTLGPVAVTGLANATTPTGAVALAQLPVQFTTGGIVTPGIPSNTAALVGALPGVPVGLTNVAPGTLSATSTDAVNGAQLNATNQLVANISVGTAGAFQSNNAGLALPPVATGLDASAGGFGAKALGAASTVVGNNASDNANANATVLGNGASVAPLTPGSNVALGQGSVASTGAQANYTAFGLTPLQNAVGTVSVGGLGAERTISNVAAGRAGTDAVNIAQLSGATASLGASVAAKLGGGTAADPAKGQLTGGFTVNGTTYADVASAVSGAAATGGVVQRTGTANQVAVTALGGTGAAPGVAQTVTNVAAGTVAAASADAVNGSQLFGTAQSVSTALGGGSRVNPDGTVAAPTYVVAGGSYTDVGSALSALDGGISSGKLGAFVADNTGNKAQASASGADASAGGFGAVASGAGSTAVGNAAVDNGVANSTVLGSGASVAGGLTGSNVALGQGSVASTGAQTNYAAFGLTPLQNAVGTVSVGSAGAERTISNVAAGVAGTDAVNVAQLSGTAANLGGSVATSLGGGASYDPATGKLLASTYTVGGKAYGDVGSALAAGNALGVQYTPDANGNPTNAIDLTKGGTLAPVTVSGVAAGAVGAGSTQAVNGSQLFGTAQSVSTALGGGSRVNPDGTVAAPAYAVAGGSYTDVGSALNALDSGISSGKLGAFVADNTGNKAQASASGADASAGGFGAVASGAGSTAVGNAAVDNGVANSTVLGSGASITAGLTGSNVALGQGSVASTGAQANYTAFGLTPLENAVGTVSVGSAGAERTVSNVAAGVAGTDAVNVAQLSGAAANLGGSVATGLGGGASYDPVTGTIAGPSYTVAGNAYSNVGDALAAGNKASVQYTTDAAGNPTNAIDLTKGGTLAPSTVSGVAPGALSATSTEAVNGSQLYATNQTVANLASGKGGAFVADNTSGQAVPAATGADAAAGGFGAVASGARSTALGAGAASSGTNSVALGAGSTDGGVADVVSVGAAGAERRITNVATGVNPTDAANTGQLTALAARSLQYDTTATGQTNYQSVTLNPTGSGPVTIHNVAAGMALTDAVNVGQLNAVSANSVQYATNPDGTRSNTLALVGGNAAAPVTVSNVAAGVAATDAVNVGQLQGALNARYNNLAQIGEYQFRSAKMAAYAGTSIALATAGIRYDDRPGKISLGIGASGYHGSAGLAVGVGATSEDGRWRLNVSAAFSPNSQKGAAGIMGGASYTFN